MKPIVRIIGIWIIFVIDQNLVFGQTKFSFSLSAAPYYNYIKTASILQLPLPTGNTYLPVDVHYQQKGQGYSVGLIVRYEFTPRFSVSTGILLNHVHSSTPIITTNPDLTLTPNLPQIIGAASKRRNAQVPLFINYQSSTRRLSPYFSAGAFINFPYATIYAEGSGTTPHQKIRLYPTLGAGVLYRLSDHFSLIAQPTFTYIVPGSAYTSYQFYQLSLQTQLMYKF